ncbi:MAG: hypothetical protein ACRC2S_28515 [Waterburya sp.]
MVAVTKRNVDMTDMIVCDEQTRLFLSKPQKKNALLRPEFGQEVVLTQAVIATATQINVEALQENIKAGTILTFKNAAGTTYGSTTVGVSAIRGNKTITVSNVTLATAGNAQTPPSIPKFLSAMTNGIEQTLTVGTAVVAGVRSITLSSATTDWIEKGRTLTFEPSGVEIVLREKAELGETSLSIEPAPFAIPVGEDAEIKNYLEVVSINQLDDSSSANTLNERNFRSGSGTGKSVTSYNDTLSISGNYIKGDFALSRLYNAKQDPSLRGYILYAVITEAEGGQNQRAKVWLGQHGNQRPNDQTKKISATLEVDGILEDFNVPEELLN